MQETFGKKMQRWRERANISQAELARRMDVSRNYVSNLERDFSSTAKGGKPQPSVETCDKIARALGVKIGEVRLAAGYAAPSSNVETVPDDRAAKIGEMVSIFSILPAEGQSLALAIIKLLKDSTATNTPNPNQQPKDHYPDEFIMEDREEQELPSPQRKGGRH